MTRTGCRSSFARRVSPTLRQMRVPAHGGAVLLFAGSGQADSVAPTSEPPNRAPPHRRRAAQTEALVVCVSGVEVYGERLGLREVDRETPSLFRGLPRNNWFTGKIALTRCYVCATLRGGLAMEGDRGESEVGRVDVANAADLVGRTIRDIDAGGAAELNGLLTDLLCAAWPTPRAQSQ